MLLFKLVLVLGLVLRVISFDSTLQCSSPRMDSDCRGARLSGSKNGTITKALESLQYHRKMMNEFLLSNYLSEILLNTSMSRKKRGSSQTAIQKRYGADLIDNINIFLNGNYTKGMLKNEGSTVYENWLEKNNDYSSQKREMVNTHVNDELQNNIFQGDLSMENEDYDYGFQYGHISGYPYSNSTLDKTLYEEINSSPLNTLIRRKPMSKTGYENIYDEHKTHYIEESTMPILEKGKEIGLRDIADITMTTLAFLSFGTFILQVLICITMGKDNVNMALQADGTESQGGVIEEIRRKRRSIALVGQRLITENILSHLALRTIDSLLNEDEDESCRHYNLCKNSEMVMKQKSNSKLWIPLWSLSLSWLRSSLVTSLNKKQNGMEQLNNLKAIVLGLVPDSNCKIFYVSKCIKRYNAKI